MPELGLQLFQDPPVIIGTLEGLLQLIDSLVEQRSRHTAAILPARRCNHTV